MSVFTAVYWHEAYTVSPTTLAPVLGDRRWSAFTFTGRGKPKLRRSGNLPTVMQRTSGLLGLEPSSGLPKLCSVSALSLWFGPHSPCPEGVSLKRAAMIFFSYLGMKLSFDSLEWKVFWQLISFGGFSHNFTVWYWYLKVMMLGSLKIPKIWRWDRRKLIQVGEFLFLQLFFY